MAAQRVYYSNWEPRPENAEQNNRVPRAKRIRAFRRETRLPDRYRNNITGNFRGTTDEIIQWAAQKWGFEPNLLRAVAARESWWKMSAVGDNGQSFGIMQIKVAYHHGTWPLAKRSTAFNLDYYGGQLRYYYDGASTWLNNVERGREYRAGDLWGSVGAWYAGRWYANGAESYIEKVKRYYDERPWLRYGF